MNPESRLASLFDIRPDERRLVGHMLLLALCLGVPGIATETASYSLFLAEFDAQALPYIYLGFALTAVATGFAYGRLERRLSFRAMATFQTALLLVSLVAFRLLLGLSGAGWALFLLAVWSDTVWVLIALTFWTLAGRLFNMQQGKRLFGLLAAGLIVTEVATGFLTPLIVSTAGTANLLLVAAAALALGLAVQSKILNTFTASPDDGDEEEEADEAVSLRSLLGDSYIALIVGLAAVTIAAYYFLDNLFYSQASLAFPDPDQLAGFLGVFFAIAGVGTALAGAFLSRRLTGRYGVIAGLMVMPLVLLLGTVATAAAAAATALAAAAVVTGSIVFWLLSGTKLMSDVLNESVNRSSFRVLYQPLSPSRRIQLQTAAESMVEPAAAGTAGLLLLLLNSLGGGSVLPIVLGLLLLLLAAAVLVLRLRRSYPERLQQSLHSRLLGRGQLLEVDRSALLALKEGLSDRRPGATIYILDLLESAEPEEYQATLAELLDHPEELVQLDVLRRIERGDFVHLLPAVQRRLDVEPGLKVRGAAIRTLAVLGDDETAAFVHPYLEANEPELRVNAAAGLLRSGDLDNMLAAGERLLSWVHDPAAAERVVAARTLRSAGLPSLHRPIAELLGDEEMAVRRAALEAAGEVHSPNLMPLVIEEICSPNLRGAAMRSLAACGDTSLPAIAAALAEGGQSPEATVRLARVCGAIGDSRAAEVLLPLLERPDVRVRQQAAISLGRCGYRDDGRVDVEGGVRQNLERAAWLLAGLLDLEEWEANGRAALLGDALRQALAGQRRALFAWLALEYEPRAMRRAARQFEGLESGVAGDQRAYAQEIVEVTVGAPLKEWLRPLLEPLSPQERLSRLEESFPQPRLDGRERLLAIIAAPAELATPWLRACAVYAAANSSVDLSALAPEVAAADPLLAETLAWTGAATSRPDEGDAVAGKDTAAGKGAGADKDRSRGQEIMLTTIEKVIALKSVDLFADTADEVLASVAGIAVEVAAEAKERIIEAGDAGDSLYVIVEGQVSVHDGETEFDRLGANNVFGEMTLLDPAPRSASVTAVVDSQLLRLDREPFFELLEEHPEISQHIMQLLTRRLRRVLERLSVKDDA